MAWAVSLLEEARLADGSVLGGGGRTVQLVSALAVGGGDVGLSRIGLSGQVTSEDTLGSALRDFALLLASLGVLGEAPRLSHGSIRITAVVVVSQTLTSGLSSPGVRLSLSPVLAFTTGFRPGGQPNVGLAVSLVAGTITGGGHVGRLFVAHQSGGRANEEQSSLHGY